jgi:plastocyanin
MLYKPLVLSLAIFVVAAIATSSRADDAIAELRFDQHQFKPLKLEVPAGRPLIIKVTNTSKETIEFESFKLNREKAVSPGETIIVHLPALSPGTYDFYDDFHQDVPEGTIVAK